MTPKDVSINSDVITVLMENGQAFEMVLRDHEIVPDSPYSGWDYTAIFLARLTDWVSANK